MTIHERIPAEACTCDRPEQFKLQIPVREALGRIDDQLSPVDGVEEVKLTDAPGRILATPVRAHAPAPPFDNSAMDGYALDAACLQGVGPWSLPVVGRLPAGQMPDAPLPCGTAIRVFTGAPIPKGATAVVMQEDIERDGDRILVRTAPRAGAHIRRTGEDMAAGDEIVTQGKRLARRDIAAIAAAGQDRVTVRRKLRVALLVTGDELRAPDLPQPEAAINDINGPMLRAALDTPAIDLIGVDHCGDSRGETETRLATALRSADLVITTGGISVGEEDHVTSAIAALGARRIFSGVALKPGKPVSLSRMGAALWLGLPGNPLSAFVTWQLFGTAIIDRLTGGIAPERGERPVVIARDIHRKPGRSEYRLARISGTDELGRAIVDFEAATHSGRVARLPDMDGLIHLPSDLDRIPKGSLVAFRPFHDL